ncbi:uncharacterized protein LOC114538616 isoform X3 [Dendronephthya gigantea]|uniref:uncharacterized protein LOC114538616 isoform X3 n=1 Tax=Dendronephthya gigantea TaxID=151771 RepID=UPI00106A2128|nr:uncharacterized protein LOC114538616 isoform X3 [Dendronephthya gigantea]
MKSSTQSMWTRRMQSVDAAWENSRSAIFAAVLKSQAIPKTGAVCFLCGEDRAVVRCRHCGPDALLCNNCDETAYEKKPLHDRDIWINGFYQAIPPTETVLPDGSPSFNRKYPPFLFCKECIYCKGQDTLSIIPSNEMCILITAKGRFDLYSFTYSCTGCDQQFSPLTLEKIINEGYWPGGPKNLNYIFCEDVFRVWDSLRKYMPGTSETAFRRSLASISSEKGRSGIINASVFHCAFKEWCFAMHEVDILQEKQWANCPSCFRSQHSCHVDGNAKLYRYNSVPRGERKCYYENTFIEDDELVEEHLNNVYSNNSAKGHSSNSYCGSSHWKAARNTVNRQSKLDETGLVVAGCRHSLAQSAVNMHQGHMGWTLANWKWLHCR